MQPPALQLVQSQTDWRQDWTHIVAGRFSNSPFSGFLFYEQSTGVAELYETDGRGNLSLLRHYDDSPTTSTLIVPGVFGPSGFTGLLLYDQAAGLYDQAAGYGAIYDTDDPGQSCRPGAQERLPGVCGRPTPNQKMDRSKGEERLTT